MENFLSMSQAKRAVKAAPRELPKAPTGIQGLDEITGGGLPRGRPTLVCGSAGCGKTLLAMEFLIRGATQFGEPGVFMAFEETAQELTQNVRSLGFDLEELEAQNKFVVDYVHVERSEIEETGEYSLEGLFIRLGLAIDSIAAKRVVLDTIETLFGGLSNAAILRSELRRLFRWLKDKGVTTIITGERGEGQLTRQGLEEYVSDCVILLDHRVTEQMSTRRLRVVKYRGTHHGTNEYPFLIDEFGISVLPVTSMGLNHPASSERISSGVPNWMSCSAAKAIIGAPVSWSRARRAWARPAWLPIWPMPPAAGARSACISPLRSRSGKWSATCAPSVLTWSHASKRDFCSSMLPAPRSMDWNPIWSQSINSSRIFSRGWSSWTRSPISLPPAPWAKFTPCSCGWWISSKVSRSPLSSQV
jgi:KaiC/GvpD/RAD55 family RecA-like ATPase